MRSALMIEGAERARGRAWRCAGRLRHRGAGRRSVSLLLLENMAASLYEVARVSHDVIIPDFVMDMRAGAAAGGPDVSDRRAFGDLRADLHCNRGKMAVACMNAEPWSISTILP